MTSRIDARYLYDAPLVLRSKAPPKVTWVSADTLSFDPGISFITDQGTVITAVNYTKSQVAAFAVGTGGGAQTGFSKTNQYVDVYAVFNPTTMLMDYKFMQGGAAFVAELGYTEYRRILTLKTDASGNFRDFYMDGDRIMYKTPTLDAFVTNLTTARQNFAPQAPVNSRAIVRTVVKHASSSLVIVCPKYEPDIAPSTTVAPLATHEVIGAASDMKVMEIDLDSSAEFAARATASSTSLYVMTLGYYDRRGRDF